MKLLVLKGPWIYARLRFWYGIRSRAPRYHVNIMILRNKISGMPLMFVCGLLARPKALSIYSVSVLIDQVWLGQPFSRNLYLVGKYGYEVESKYPGLASILQRSLAWGSQHGIGSPSRALNLPLAWLPTWNHKLPLFGFSYSIVRSDSPSWMPQVVRSPPRGISCWRASTPFWELLGCSGLEPGCFQEHQ